MLVFKAGGRALWMKTVAPIETPNSDSVPNQDDENKLHLEVPLPEQAVSNDAADE